MTADYAERTTMGTRLRAMIEAQPGALRAVSEIDVTAAAKAVWRGRRVILVGTGTSFHAAELGAYLLRTGGVDATAVPSAELARWRPKLDRADAVVVISHTGSTAYALAVRDAAKEAAAPLVAVTGPQADWDGAITTPMAERSETYTVSYTAALGVVGLLAHAVGGTPTGPAELRRAADDVERLLGAPGVVALPVPERALAIVGAGPWSVTAREGALKVREAAHLLAEGFDPERLLHGAAVPFGPGDTVVGLQPSADRDALLPGILDAAAAEGAAVHVVESSEPSSHPFMAQFAATVRLQLLAAHLTELRGTDPDEAITGAWARDELWSAGAPATVGASS
jgi:glucosamine--fructose-6-phosphate aminotransferase (isomerizing)